MFDLTIRGATKTFGKFTLISRTIWHVRKCEEFHNNPPNAQYSPTGHDDHYDDELYSIPQLDGPSSPPHSLVHPTAPPQDKPAFRRASYTLDKKKQLSRLCKDTKLENYEITVSPIAPNFAL